MLVPNFRYLDSFFLTEEIQISFDYMIIDESEILTYNYTQ